jgi:hypothetical protein
MNLDKSTTDLISVLELGLQSTQTFMQAYIFFQQETIVEFIKKLLPYKKDIIGLKVDDNFRREILSILDIIAHETEMQKLDHWKNAILRLATDFHDFSFKNNFIKILQDLTIFDLTVLTKIYSTNFNDENFDTELVDFFQAKDAPKQFVNLALKRLATYNLISEVSNRANGDVGIADPISLSPLYYIKNELGTEFLRFISEDFIDY